MDHVDLTAYPFPEGIRIPNLMPEQGKAFNGDGYIAAEILRLKWAHSLTAAFETGTCLGSSTIWFAQHFGFITSTEISAQYMAIAMKRMNTQCQGENWMLLCASAADLLDELRDNVGHDTLCFLDAHPMTGKGEEGYATVIRELMTIAEAKVTPCIVVHDMQVPHLPQAGWDTYNGQPFTLEWITPYLNRIYGEGGWKHTFPTKVEGAMRGWVSIEPA